MAEVLHGAAAGDQLNASADKTQVYGLAGNDTLTSNGKSDVLLVGGSGDDSLIINGGNGTLAGGDGSDVFNLNYSATNKLSVVIEDLEPARDKIVVNFDGETVPQLSSVVSGNDVIWADGNLLSVTLKSVRENDYFDDEAADEIWAVLAFTNYVRERENLSPLTLSDGLTAGAQIRAEEITSLGEIGLLNDHTRPDGSDFSTVLNNKYANVGENLDGGATSPEQAMTDWIGSASHYANIVNPNFLKLGVGYNYDDPDPSNHRWYWTQLFADSLNNPETVSTENLLSANIEVNAKPKLITLSDAPETYSNTDFGATIAALGGDDSISNDIANVSISGGADNDTLDNSGDNSTINGGHGNDSINLALSTGYNVIQYTSGDGSDTVNGFNATDLLSISGGEYIRSTVDNDLVFTVDDGSVRLVDVLSFAAAVNVDGTRSKFVPLSEYDDTYQNSVEGATVLGLGGNDSISNINLLYGSSNVSIGGGTGNDTIDNWNGTNVTISAGDGNDNMSNYGSKVTIDGGTGNDSIYNWESNFVSINAGDGDNYISNSGSSVSINAGDGNDKISNWEGNSVSINAGDGDDEISNWEGNSVSINAGDGDDEIHNWKGNFVTITAGDGDNYISNSGSSVSINAGDGDNYISNSGSSVSINAGDGDNYISNDGDDVSIDTGVGKDFVHNNGSTVTINADAGNDSIENGLRKVTTGNDDGTNLKFIDVVRGGDSVAINLGGGNDTIRNMGSFVSISGGKENDIISLSSDAKNNLILYTAGDGRDTVLSFDENDTLRIGDGTGTYSTHQNVFGDLIVNVGRDFVNLGNVTGLSALNIEGTLSDAIEIDNYIMIGLEPTYNNSLDAVTISAAFGGKSITNSGSNVSIYGGPGYSTVDNSGTNVRINTRSGNSKITNSGDNVNIDGGFGDDSITTSGDDVTINGGFGDDIISLSADSQDNLILYTQGDGNDIISGFKATDSLSILGNNYASVTVGNDVIVSVGTNFVTLLDAATLSSINSNVTPIVTSVTVEGNRRILREDLDYYANTVNDLVILALSGNDSIFNAGDNVSIDGGMDNDYVLNIGASASIDGGAGDDSIDNYRYESSIGANATIYGGEGNDFIDNWGNSVTIDGGDGNDNMSNYGSKVTIDGGTGNDSIYNWESNFVSVAGGDGDDTIDNSGSNVTIDAGNGNDSIDNSSSGKSNILINAGGGDDSVENWGADNVTISGDAGNDFINNRNSANATIYGGEGNDSIDNGGNSVTIDGGDGDDTISNVGDSVTIDGSSGNDSINNGDFYDSSFGTNVSINGGFGDDTINNGGNNVSITGGTGDDQISLSSDAANNLIQYADGDGDDTIWGFNSSSTVNILDGDYEETVEGDDVILKVGDGSIRLVGARDKPLNIIIGASGSSGGNSGNDGGGGSSSGGNGGDSSGGDGAGGNDSGSESSGGNSQADSDGRSTSGTGNSSGGGRSRGGNGGSVRTATSTRPTYTNVTPTSAPTSITTTTPTTTISTPTITPTTTPNQIYNGGNQIISDYTSGQAITFNAIYTGAVYDGEGNFFVGSTIGALVIQNATDKVIDLRDGAGNEFLKAYSASTPGVIDGRGLNGFELISGSTGSDVIQAGNDGSQLWGGNDTVTDALLGGNGTDIFVGGKSFGSDAILNAAVNDLVNFADSTLSDIVATAGDGNTVEIRFNTGNIVTIQSTNELSAAVLLADGSAWRFNHSTKSWQGA